MSKATEIYQKAERGSIYLECTCASISEQVWDKLYQGATKANGSKIRKIIKKHLPDLYDALALDFRNDFEHQSHKTKTHLIYIHSATDYFLRVD